MLLDVTIVVMLGRDGVWKGSQGGASGKLIMFPDVGGGDTTGFTL